MRAGGGQAKGSSFERNICLALSLWLRDGARTDLFVRKVLSGGRYTIALARNEDHGTPGDLMAGHPMAFAFASKVLVECKAYKDLGWDSFFYSFDKSFLGRTIKLCEDQGNASHLSFMVIAKQNRRESIAIMPKELGDKVLAAVWNKVSLRTHTFHSGKYTAIPFLDIVTLVRPKVFLKALQHDPNS